ncbi:hypothetical protein BpHYR1_039260 [Brachionus plicatilis]|uniref:Uncharacterized protein n=1 Tax=Brachionus plicatilis TaxID=10195 RepID=A0A3M7SPS3_BRAPC|nr:hypothetical protein BpHYR1_039260 [Brachionus plicatilis]
MKFYKETKAKISEFIKKLHIKGKKAFEIRKKSIRDISGKPCSQIRGYKSKNLSSKKKNQIECSDGLKSAREISLEIRRVFSINLSLSSICNYRKKKTLTLFELKSRFLTSGV